MTTAPVNQLCLITGTTRGIGNALLSEVLSRNGSVAVGLSRGKDSFEENHH